MPELDISPVKTSLDSTKRLVEDFKNLLDVTRLYDTAEILITKGNGRGICMAGCGKCCYYTCVTASMLEGKNAVSWLASQSLEIKKDLLRRCEEWLVERQPFLTVYAGTDNISYSDKHKFIEEVNKLRIDTTCPFLNEETKACMVHGARPIICMAYGVTRLPVYWCPRPLGKGETLEQRITSWL